MSHGPRRVSQWQVHVHIDVSHKMPKQGNRGTSLDTTGHELPDVCHGPEKLMHFLRVTGSRIPEPASGPRITRLEFFNANHTLGGIKKNLCSVLHVFFSICIGCC